MYEFWEQNRLTDPGIISSGSNMLEHRSTAPLPSGLAHFVGFNNRNREQRGESRVGKTGLSLLLLKNNIGGKLDRLSFWSAVYRTDSFEFERMYGDHAMFISYIRSIPGIPSIPPTLAQNLSKSTP